MIDSRLESIVTWVQAQLSADKCRLSWVVSSIENFKVAYPGVEESIAGIIAIAERRRDETQATLNLTRDMVQIGNMTALLKRLD